MAFFAGRILPYIACGVFLTGTILRVAGWLRIGVPFQLTLFPASGDTADRIATVVTEFLLCRSLYREDKLLWLWVWLFHLSLVTVVAGHVLGIYFLRSQFTPIGLSLVTSRLLSSFLGGMTGIVMMVSLSVLLSRRILNPEVRKLSQPENYFELLLLSAIVLSGVLMYLPGFHVDTQAVRAYMGGLISLNPVPFPHSLPFIIHFMLVNMLLLYFPFSRLLHSAGFFVNRAMLAEAPPVYPTPACNAPRSDFATGKIHPDIPVSHKAAVDKEVEVR
jgi:nitrate reductase gamma subunit